MTPTQLEKIKGELEKLIYDIIYCKSRVDVIRYCNEDEWPVEDLAELFLSRLKEVEEEVYQGFKNYNESSFIMENMTFPQYMGWEKEPVLEYAKKKYARNLKSNKLERENTEGCDDCKWYPNKWVQVTDIKNPHCLKCGRKLNIK